MLLQIKTIINYDAGVSEVLFVPVFVWLHFRIPSVQAEISLTSEFMCLRCLQTFTVSACFQLVYRVKLVQELH